MIYYYIVSFQITEYVDLDDFTKKDVPQSFFVKVVIVSTQCFDLFTRRYDFVHYKKTNDNTAVCLIQVQVNATNFKVAFEHDTKPLLHLCFRPLHAKTLQLGMNEPCSQGQKGQSSVV